MKWIWNEITWYHACGNAPKMGWFWDFGAGWNIIVHHQGVCEYLRRFMNIRLRCWGAGALPSNSQHQEYYIFWQGISKSLRFPLLVGGGASQNIYIYMIWIYIVIYDISVKIQRFFWSHWTLCFSMLFSSQRLSIQTKRVEHPMQVLPLSDCELGKGWEIISLIHHYPPWNCEFTPANWWKIKFRDPAYF